MGSRRIFSRDGRRNEARTGTGTGFAVVSSLRGIERTGTGTGFAVASPLRAMMEIGVYDFDDDIIGATSADGVPRLKIYRPEFTCVVLGRGSRAEVELYVDEVERDQVPVLRRHGGGCAVVLDPGNVIVSVTLKGVGFRMVNEHFSAISEWLIKGLGEAGVHDVRREGISDIAVGDRKIGGACMQMKREYVYYSVSLMFEPDVALMEKYLRHPPHEPGYRKKRGHREFVGEIRKYLDDGQGMGVEDFMGRLGGVLDVGELG